MASESEIFVPDEGDPNVVTSDEPLIEDHSDVDEALDQDRTDEEEAAELHKEIEREENDSGWTIPLPDDDP
jgi:hypothetical protein